MTATAPRLGGLSSGGLSSWLSPSAEPAEEPSGEDQPAAGQKLKHPRSVP